MGSGLGGGGGVCTWYDPQQHLLLGVTSSEEQGGGAPSSPQEDQASLFVLLGFWLLPLRLALPSHLLGLLLLGDGGELGLAHLVSFGLGELLGLLVELVQVELSDDVLLETHRQALTPPPPK